LVGCFFFEVAHGQLQLPFKRVLEAGRQD
jgi:hypothetical protein